MSAHYEFKWPKGPQEVIVTGTLDNWSKSTPLFKHADGTFTLQVPLPVNNEPLLYKYIVDGEWRVNPDEKITKDFEGNENNVLDPEDLKELVSIPGALIPESGLVYGSNNHDSTTSKQPDVSTTNETTNKNEGLATGGGAAIGSSSDEYKHTVLPKEEPHQTSLTGEPGIQIPQDKESLAVFDQYESTDPKSLNKDVKEVGTANTETDDFNQGIQIPQETAAFEKFEDTDPKVLNENVKEVGTAPSPSESKDVTAGVSGVPDDTAAATAAATIAAAGAAGVGAGTDDTNASSSSPPVTEGEKLRKVKRVQYKSKPNKDATVLDQETAPNSSKDAEFVPVPAAIETGNEASNLDYVNDDSKVTPSELKNEAAENDQLNKEVRDEYEKPKDKDVNEPLVATKDTAVSAEDDQPKHHSTAKVLGAAALGGAGGAGLGSALASDAHPDQPEDGIVHKDSVHGPFSSAKEARESVSADPHDSTAPVVVDDKHPKTLDPKAGQEEPAPGTTAPSTLAAEPDVKPITGSDLDAKEVNASPVAKDDVPHATAAPKSRVSAAAPAQVVDDEGDDNEEEEIIIAQGNQDDILAAVEASEGHDVTLEEIKPTKSEQERLTREAELAAQEKGPITIEPVAVPEEELVSSKGSSKGSDKQSSSKGKDVTSVPVKTTKKQDKGKDEEEKKKKKKRGFRSLFSRK